MVMFKVDGTVIKQKGSYQAVADSVGYLDINFDFSEEWQECDCIVVVTTSRANASDYNTHMLNGNTYTVPANMMVVPGFFIGLVGYKYNPDTLTREKKITSQVYEVAVKRSILNNDISNPDDQPDSLFDQAVNELNTARNAINYVHIKWADDEPTANSDMKDVPADWLGIYCDNEKQESPTEYTAYKWYKVKGAKGDQGIQGLQGVQGVGISNVTFKETAANGDRIYTVLLTDGTGHDITVPKGSKGDKGNVNIRLTTVIPDELEDGEVVGVYTP